MSIVHILLSLFVPLGYVCIHALTLCKQSVNAEFFSTAYNGSLKTMKKPSTSLSQ